MLIFPRASFVPSAKKNTPTTDLPRLAEEKSKPLGEKEVDQQTAKNLEELVWCDVNCSLDASATVFFDG